MNKREKLAVEKRSTLGKQVKKLRRTGVIPANIYGADFSSVSVQLPVKEFNNVYAIAGETGLVDLELDGQVIPVLIKNIQANPVTGDVLHADFHKVNLKEKVTAKIPVEAVGEAKAAVDEIGLLEQPMMEVEIEALPTELPEKIEVNIENLAAVGDQIVVSDLSVPAGVEVLSEPSQVVFKIGELITKEMEEQMAADAAETEAAAEETAAEGAEVEKKEGEGESAEGVEETAAEGEAKTEESESKDAKPQE